MPGLEAAACRCPIVATQCGGPEDYVTEGVSGYLVPVGDGAAMADRVHRVLSLDEPAWQAMSEASYQNSLAFDWDRSAEHLEYVLTEALAGRWPSRPDPVFANSHTSASTQAPIVSVAAE